MPTYDFICNKCNQRFETFLTFAEYGKKTVTCAHCGSKNVRRRMTKVRIAKSEESRMENLADPSLMSGLESEDPRALASFMRKMSGEMGEPLDAEMTEVLDRLEAGESPDSIDADFPDLGDDGGMGMGGMGGMGMGGMDMGGGFDDDI